MPHWAEEYKRFLAVKLLSLPSGAKMSHTSTVFMVSFLSRSFDLAHC